MQSEVVVSVGEIAERNLAVTGKLVELPERMLMSSYDSRLKVCQIWIVLHESDMFWGSSLHGFLGSALGGCLAGSFLAVVFFAVVFLAEVFFSVAIYHDFRWFYYLIKVFKPLP